jgi:hypothetical protein
VSAHTCHAMGCNVAVPPRMFMCRRHWYMLPKTDRALVWALYIPGQERDWNLVTDDYLTETMRIINDLAEREAGGP